jgi:flagellar protein FlbD
MIKLTRLNGKTIALNSDLVKMAEASPDTMLTLINGEKLIVREGLRDVMERVIAYRARLLATVAAHLSSSDELLRITSIASLDVAAYFDSGAAGSPPEDERG